MKLNSYLLLLLLIKITIFSINSAPIENIISIQSNTIYETPFFRNQEIFIVVVFESDNVTEAYVKFYNEDNSTLFYNHGLSTVIEKSISFSFYSSAFFEYDRLDAELPIYIQVEPPPDSNWTLNNNRKKLEYYSEYFNKLAKLPNSESLPHEVFLTPSTMKPPSGFNAQCLLKREIVTENPNYYNYYYSQIPTGDKSFMTPFKRSNDSLIYYFLSYSIPATVSNSSVALSFLILDPTPTISTFPDTLICAESSTTVINFESEFINLNRFSKSFILLNTDNQISELEIDNSDTIAKRIYKSPSFKKITDNSFLTYVAIDKRGPNAFTENILVTGSTIEQVSTPHSVVDPNANPNIISSKFFTQIIVPERYSIPTRETLKSSYVAKFKISFSNITMVDFINIYSSTNTLYAVPLSKASHVFSMDAWYYFPLNTNSIPSQGEIRIYYRDFSYYSSSVSFQTASPIVISTTIIIDSAMQGDFVQFSNINRGYLPVLRYGFGLVLSGGNTLLPSKFRESQFPYGFKGSLIACTFRPELAIMEDTPSQSIYSFYVNDPSNSHLLSSITTQNVNDQVDLLPPMAKINVLYNQPLPPSSYYPLDTFSDFIRISISEYLGIDNERCILQYGPYIFNIDASHRIKGDNINGESNYLFAFQLNRYFCFSPISFICEDIRGNTINWNTNLIDEELVITRSSSTCQREKPFHSFNIISIDSTIIDQQGILFAVTIQQITDNQPNNYDIILFLDNQVSDTHIQYELHTVAQKNISHSSTYVYYSDVEPLPIASPSWIYEYRLIITDQDNNVMTISQSELSYISEQLSDDMKFETTITLSTFGFSGFPSDLIPSYASGTYSISSNSSFGNISSLLIQIDDYLSPIPKFQNLSVPLGNQGLISADLDIRYDSNIWIKIVCDVSNNCEEYSPSFLSISVPGLIVQPTFSNFDDLSIIYNGGFDGNSIILDTITIPNNLENRYAQLNFTITSSTFEISPTTNPILYFVENYSLNRLEFPLYKSGSNYLCNISIPLNWGARGINHYSIYNIISKDVGDFTGVDLTNNLPIQIQSPQRSLLKPYIWNNKVDFESSILYITGSYLGYLEDIYFQPQIISLKNQGQIFQYCEFNFIHETFGYIKLDENLLDDPIIINDMALRINTTVIPLYIETCVNPTCSGHGVCQGTTCICDSNWAGIDCSINTLYKCLNNCSGNGDCKNMMCVCNSNFMGPSCNISISSNYNNMNMGMTPEEFVPTCQFHSFNNIQTTTTLSSSTDNMNLLSKETIQTNYTIMLRKIEEVTFRGDVVPDKSFDLLNKWKLESSNSTTYYYTMPLGGDSLLTVIVYMTIGDSMNVEFAGESIFIPENSIKYYIKLENYTFTSKNNHLEFTWISYSKSPNPCETKSQNIIYGGLEKSDIHYIVIPANQLQLYGRFSNLLVVDDKTLMSSNSAQQDQDGQVIIKVSTPYFNRYVELDPDFSILLDLNAKDDKSSSSSPSIIKYDNQCNIISEQSSETLPKYVLPVAIVVSVVGVSIIITSTIMLYKKNLAIRMKVLKAKSLFSKRSESRLSKF